MPPRPPTLAVSALLLTLSLGASTPNNAQSTPESVPAPPPAASVPRSHAQRGEVFESSFETTHAYRNPFTEVEVNVVFQHRDRQWFVPAFWAGNNRWTVRFAPPLEGPYHYHLQSTDPSNTAWHPRSGTLSVGPYTGTNALLRHGFLRLAANRRHFEHADGHPFLWLADTWWKGLCQRLSWDGFRELTADRSAKGFNAVQIVCGPYPDENMMEPRWGNEGGLPYMKIDFGEVNPRYFDFADRRIQHLVDSGIVPVIVGGWGRPQAGGRSTLQQVGLDGFKRHWRHLVARYGAHPTVWILGGEARDEYGPWSDLARYLRTIDPYPHPVCYHAPGHPREAIQDHQAFDFDMVAIGHEGLKTAAESLRIMISCRSGQPTRPVLCGEACYEGHMQSNFQDIQRHLFWSFMLSGAAGHTYGAAGIWHASIEGDPGIHPIYDWTTWQEGMRFPGSTQLGWGKRLLERYPWWRFEPHPEWTEPGAFAAGIPGEVRFIYLPKRGLYNWKGPQVRNLEPNVDWHVRYLDPATGRIFDHGPLTPRTAPTHDPASPIEFQPDAPSPQDWLLILEKAPARNLSR